MTNNIIGDPKVFAVEYSISEKNLNLCYGSCGLWLANFCLKDDDATVCLNAVASSLIGIDKAEPSGALPQPFPDTSKALLLMMQGKGLTDAGAHYFLAIDGFDDFLKLFFKNTLSTDFLFSLHPDVELHRPESSSPKGVKKTTVSNKIIHTVSKMFSREISQAV